MAEMSNCVKDEFLPVTEGCTQWNFGQRPKQSGITRPADKMGGKTQTHKTIKVLFQLIYGLVYSKSKFKT